MTYVVKEIFYTLQGEGFHAALSRRLTSRWTYEAAGEGFKLAHRMYVASGPVFCNPHEPWAEAMRAW